jgi:hypothetical protein
MAGEGMDIKAKEGFTIGQNQIGRNHVGQNQIGMEVDINNLNRTQVDGMGERMDGRMEGGMERRMEGSIGGGIPGAGTNTTDVTNGFEFATSDKAQFSPASKPESYYIYGVYHYTAVLDGLNGNARYGYNVTCCGNWSEVGEKSY